MMNQRRRWSEPADTGEEHSADARADGRNGASSALSQAPIGVARERKWAWPQTLRLAIVISGMFWIFVGLAVWGYLSAR